MFFKTTDFLADKAWLMASAVIIFITIYVVVGRLAVEKIPEYRAPLEELLESRSGMEVEIDDVRAKWTFFTPIIELSKVSFEKNTIKETVFSVNKILLEVDVLSSLFVRELRLRRVVMQGLDVVIDEGQFKKITAYDNKDLLKNEETDQEISSSSSTKKTNKVPSENLVLANAIFSQRQVMVRNSSITFRQAGKPDRVFNNINAQLRNIAGKHELTGKVQHGPDRQLFEFSIRSNGFPLDPGTTINLYSHLHPGDVLLWLPEDIRKKINLAGLSVDKFKLGNRLWANWSEGKLQNITGNLYAEEIDLLHINKEASDNESKVIPSIEKLSALYFIDSINLTQKQSDLKFSISDLEFKWGRHSIKRNDIYVKLGFPSDLDPLVLTIDANEIDLGAISDFINYSDVLSPEKKKLLEQIHPEGKLKLISFEYNSFKNNKYKLNTRLDNISIKSWDGIPEIKNLSAYLSMTNRNGSMQLNSRDLEVYSPRYLRQAIKDTRLTGPLNWEIKKKKNKQAEVSVQSGIFLLGNKDVLGELMFSLLIDNEQEYPVLSLTADVEKVQANKVSDYLPPNLPPGALEWLDKGILSGEARGSIVYQGPIGGATSKKANYTLQSEVFLNASTIDYLPGDWPAVRSAFGVVFIDNVLVNFEINRGKIYDANITNLFGYVGPQEFNGDWYVNVSGQASGNVRDGIGILQDSILKNTLNHLADQWSGDGELNAKLKINIPLEDSKADDPFVDLNIDLKESQINMADYQLLFSNINGELNYSSSSGLTCSRLEADFFGNKAIINMKPIDANGDTVFNLALKSTIDMSTLYQWADQPLLAFLEGETDYIAELKVLNKPEEKSITELKVTSNLKGVGINMPSIFNKNRENLSPLLFNMTWQADDIYLRLGRQNIFNSVFKFENDELMKGEIVIGDRLASLPADNKLYADGFIKNVIWQDWEKFFNAVEIEYQLLQNNEDDFQSAENVSVDAMDKFLDSIGAIDLKTDYFQGFGLELNDVVSRTSRKGAAWNIKAKNQLLSGSILIPDGNEALDIDLDYLHWPASEEIQAVGISEYQPVTKEAPIDFPALDVNIKDFSYGDKGFGSWQVVAYPKDQFYRIEKLKVQLGDLVLTGQGQWVDGKPFPKTTLTGEITTKDVGDLMKDWGYPATIESKKGKMSYVLSWPYSPLDFDTDYLSGVVHLKIKEGRFLEVEGAASAVRVMGILNFSNLGRRLRLDFNDLFKSGLSYDSIKGPIYIKEGDLKFSDFEIKGPSTFIEADGSMNYITRKIDLDLEVSLPFSDNMIPLVTLVAGPLAGGGWFVADRLFGDKLDKAFKMQYEVSNTMDDPKVELKSRLLN